MENKYFSEHFIEQLQHREKLSFQVLFETWHQTLCYFASRIVHNPDVAEDLVQDVFVVFWKYDLSVFPNMKTIKTFLYNSVQNRCMNYLRDQEIRERNNHEARPDLLIEQDSFLFQQIEAEVVAEIFAAVDELPERCREIFRLAYLEEKEEKQIAELLNISVNTVKTQKQRAKTFLRKRLGELFIFTSFFFTGF
ncbi:MAG: RNA polymerase sigma-70 factor [Odoribacter sp.]